MKNIWSTIQAGITALGAFLGWFLGGLDGFLYTLVAFVVIDYVTGVMCAIEDHKLSSAVGFRGLCRKVLTFLLVSLILWISLRSSGAIMKLVGKSDIEAISRLMGFLLVCMGVQFIINGVLEVVRTFH